MADIPLKDKLVPRDTCKRVSLGQSWKKTVKGWRITSVKYDKHFILTAETFKR